MCIKNRKRIKGPVFGFKIMLNKFDGFITAYRGHSFIYNDSPYYFLNPINNKITAEIYKFGVVYKAERLIKHCDYYGFHAFKDLGVVISMPWPNSVEIIKVKLSGNILIGTQDQENDTYCGKYMELVEVVRWKLSQT